MLVAPHVFNGFHCHRILSAMAPKRAADKLPKPCEELKEKLKEMGLECTGENLLKLPTSLRSKSFSALASTLSTRFEGKHAQFKKLEKEEQKRDWLAAFVLDPSTGGSCTNTTTRTHDYVQQTRVLWVTEEQYSGPLFLNSVEHARIALAGESLTNCIYIYIVILTIVNKICQNIIINIHISLYIYIYIYKILVLQNTLASFIYIVAYYIFRNYKTTP